MSVIYLMERNQFEEMALNESARAIVSEFAGNPHLQQALLRAAAMQMARIAAEDDLAPMTRAISLLEEMTGEVCTRVKIAADARRQPQSEPLKEG